MSSKDKILSRLDGSGSAPDDLVLNILQRAVMDNLVEQFSKAAIQLNAEVYELDTADVTEKVTELLGGIAPLISPAVKEKFPNLSGEVFRMPMGKMEIRDFRCGITMPDYALARTGTVVEISQIPNDRLISLIPEIHIAVMRKERILIDHYSFLNGSNQSQNVTFITGPSRTADIEKRIVIGAHGPKRLIIILIP